MGIKSLMKLINSKSPAAVKEMPIERYGATTFSSRQGIMQLQDEAGNPTAHLVGLFNRTIQFLEKGVKPVWVFDGAPPVMKSGELARRKQVKDDAVMQQEKALEEGNIEEATKFAQRSVRVTPDMTQDAKTMLELLGVPVITAPCEAEAQCAAFVRAGKAYAVASEDMDSLTFAANFLLRGFNSKGLPITEINYQQMIQDFELTHEQFVDLCIILGCDYTSSIEGVGPTTGYKFIKEHQNIENVVNHIRGLGKKKYKIPADFNYEGARQLFMNPDVADPNSFTFQWQRADEQGLRSFLVGQKQFSEQRVENGIKKINSAVGKPTQTSLESFFGNAVVKRNQSFTPEPAKRVNRGRKKK